MCYWFDAQVMGVCSVHMAVLLLVVDSCPRVLALKQRGAFFFFLLLTGERVDRFIGFLLSSCQLIVLQ